MTSPDERARGDAAQGGRKDEDQLYRDASAGGQDAQAMSGAHSELVPHPWRVSEAYADERIREKLGMYESEKPRVGLENVSRDLKQAGVPAAWRLHYITAVAHLGRVGAETLPTRRDQAQRRRD